MSSRSRFHQLPGFRLTLVFTVLYLLVIVLVPLSALFFKAIGGGWDHFLAAIWSPRVIASYKLSFGVSFLAALVNGVFGLITAWVLARYEFPGRKIIDALVDLPFALPTAVAGIALTTLYSQNGWFGSFLAKYDIRAAFTPLGVGIALVFIGFPFVVRTVQPVIQDLAIEVEEAASCLGATRWQTFWRVILPALFPALFTGVTLAFGRAIGEYGSVVFISGNLPLKTEITPLLIVAKLEQFDYNGAAALGFVMLLAAFVILVASNAFQRWNARQTGRDIA